jgi:hypothetical protein
MVLYFLLSVTVKFLIRYYNKDPRILFWDLCCNKCMPLYQFPPFDFPFIDGRTVYVDLFDSIFCQ